jgi:hypothetical protein
MADEKWIEIDIDWDTGKITAAVEGYPNAAECKAEIMELIEDMVDISEFGFTIEITKPPKPNAKQRRTTKGKGKKKTTN